MVFFLCLNCAHWPVGDTEEKMSPMWHKCCMKVGGVHNVPIYFCVRCHLGSTARLDDLTDALNLAVPSES
jgi:hypothetical protein